MKKTPACDNCRFYDAVSTQAGQCRRHPINASREKPITGIGWWPLAPAGGWCGEYQEQPEVKPLSRKEKLPC